MEIDQQASNLDLTEKKIEARADRLQGASELLFDEDRLRIYYDRIFPYKLMFKWISYNKLVKQDQKALMSLEDGVSSSYFHNREFSFTLANDVYCRYLCFKTAENFKETLVNRVPYKIDIGAVYNIPPERHNASDKKAFVPTHKEMVFDIDMNDYDDVRTCCKGANVCERCFVYLKIAMVVLTDILGEDFNFTNLLWVFSGRRGIHAWVCDEAAREMQNDMRQAVVGYCNLGVGNEMSGKMQLSYPLHPRLKKIYPYLKKKFEEVIIGDHNLLSLEEHQKKFLAYLPDDQLRKTVGLTWKNMSGASGQDLWQAYQRMYHEYIEKMKNEERSTNKKTSTVYQSRWSKDLSLQALIFTYLYPRIDANVSTGINHLLKSPWCIHPKTGKYSKHEVTKFADMID